MTPMTASGAQCRAFLWSKPCRQRKPIIDELSLEKREWTNFNDFQRAFLGRFHDRKLFFVWGVNTFFLGFYKDIQESSNYPGIRQRRQYDTP